QPWLRGKEELLLTIVNEDLVSFMLPPARWPQTSNNAEEKKDRSLHLSVLSLPVQEVNCTLFLLAGYVKYGRPYAWIRSNHERLVNIGGTDSMVRDTPMKLRSIADWQTRGTRVWDVVSELVCLCTVPSPSNPFALDMRYIKGLPLPDRFLVTGALLGFLETYVVYGNRDDFSVFPVVEEVKPLRRLHVQALLELQRTRESAGSAASATARDSSREE
uniref:Si:dkey-19b23.7 n=1 Tax=Salarias fasciatus TaxID=181472 RepID=A0A672J0V1_SALFA